MTSPVEGVSGTGPPSSPPEVEVNRSSNPAAQTTLLLRLGGDDPRSADLGGVSADLGGVSADLGREPSGAEGAAEGAAVACGSVSHGTGSHSPR
jgi:hypothetical protein